MADKGIWVKGGECKQSGSIVSMAEFVSNGKMEKEGRGAKRAVHCESTITCI